MYQRVHCLLGQQKYILQHIKRAGYTTIPFLKIEKIQISLLQKQLIRTHTFFYKKNHTMRLTGIRPELVKLFSCSAQLSMIFQLLIKNLMLENKLLVLKLSNAVFILLINVKMPQLVGI